MKKLYSLMLLCAAMVFASSCSDDDNTDNGMSGYVKSVTLDKTSYIVALNKTVKLSATVETENLEDKSVVWGTADASIATVDKDGLVTGKAVGKVVITAASTADASKKATCEITVTDKVLVAFDELTASVNEHDGILSLPFHLSIPLDEEVTVTFARGTDDRQTAKLGKHFSFPDGKNTVTLPAGTVNSEVKVKIHDNTFCDGNVYFDLAVRGVTTGVEIGTDSINKVTIEDDDYELLFTQTKYEVDEGGSIQVDFTLSRPAESDIQLFIRNEYNPELPMFVDLIYENVDGRYTIPKGEKKGSFTLSVGKANDDYKDWQTRIYFEGANEDLSQGYVNSYYSAIVTIKNTDKAPDPEPEPDPIMAKIGFVPQEYKGLAAGEHKIAVKSPDYPIGVMVWLEVSSTTVEPGAYSLKNKYVMISAHQTTADVSLKLDRTLQAGESIEVKMVKAVLDDGAGTIDNQCIDALLNTCIIKP